MHPEIEAALTNVSKKYPVPNAIALQNAEKLLNYIGDRKSGADRPICAYCFAEPLYVMER